MIKSRVFYFVFFCFLSYNGNVVELKEVVMAYKRWQESLIKAGLKYRRVLVIEGARQCGKTTLAEMLAKPNAIYRSLDDPMYLKSARLDPAGFISHGDELMIIDEVQRAPDLLLAIKLDVDKNKKMGRYLLTGSANIQSAPGVIESLAGRIKTVRLRPLAMGEICGNPPRFIERAFNGEFVPIPSTPEHKKSGDRVIYNKDQYLAYAMLGGFPEPRAIKNNEHEQGSWYKDYFDALIKRDLQEISNIKNAVVVADLIKILAAWSSKFMDVSAICSALGASRGAVESHINALEALFLVEYVHPWHKTDYDRVGKQKKMFMTDTGMLAHTLSWDLDRIRLDGDKNGKLMETFVFNQLAALIDAQKDPYELFHYRDREQREVDFIIENKEGDILGIEVKAGSIVDASMFKHLKWFAKNMASGRSFKGIVLYTGEYVVPFGDNLWAVPINCLWS